MWADLVELMAEGVRTGRIDTVRPEHTPEAMGRAPRRDDHGGEVYVYRRTSMPCLVCGTDVRTAELAGRNILLVSPMSAHLPLARRTVCGQGHTPTARSSTVSSAREPWRRPSPRERVESLLNGSCRAGRGSWSLLVLATVVIGAAIWALPTRCR